MTSSYSTKYRMRIAYQRLNHGGRATWESVERGITIYVLKIDAPLGEIGRMFPL